MTTLRIALQKVDFLPADRVTDDTSILTLKNLVMEPLCRWQDGVLEPALLGRWEHSRDGRHWRFEIRPHATFHDAKPCRAEDILDFIEGILDSRDTFGMPWAYARYFAHARFTLAADDAFEMHSAEPIGDVLEIFSEFYICRSTAQGLPLLGTGPYRVEHFEAGQQAVLCAVQADVEPRRLVVNACTDASQRYRQLVDGSVDVATSLEHCHERLDFDPRWIWQRQLNTLSVMQYLNCGEGLFRNPLARLAANHAVDAQGIVDELFQGLGQASSTVVSPWHTGARQSNSQPLVYDPEQACALLDQVGGAAEIILRSPEYMPEKALQVTERVLHALQQVGIRGRIEVQSDRPEYARQIGRRQMGDVAIFDSSPHSTFRVLNDKISSAVRGTWWQGFTDPTLEPLIIEANRTLDPLSRQQAYGRCLARLNQNPPWLYLFHPHVVSAAAPIAAGIRLGAKGDLLINR